jgi:hypothetical protein
MQLLISGTRERVCLNQPGRKYSIRDLLPKKEDGDSAFPWQKESLKSIIMERYLSGLLKLAKVPASGS